MNNIDNILRRIHVNPFANFSEISDRQKEMLNAISQMIQNNEMISEQSISMKIRKITDIDIRSCFWSLWHKKVLVTNCSHR